MAILQPVQRVRGVLPVKRSRVRRSLAFSGEIGEGNTKHNIHFAERLSTISVEDCAKKWNFDVNKGVPIAGGRFSWSLIDPNTPLDLTPPPVTPGSDAGQKGQSEAEDAGVKPSDCAGGDGAGVRSRDEVTEGHTEVKGQEKEEEGMTKGRREERRGEFGGKRRRDEEDEEDAVLSSSSSSSSSSAAVTASASSSSSSPASSPLRQTSIADYTREKKKRKTTTTSTSTTTPQSPHQSPHKKVLLQIRA